MAGISFYDKIPFSKALTQFEFLIIPSLQVVYFNVRLFQMHYWSLKLIILNVNNFVLMNTLTQNLDQIIVITHGRRRIGSVANYYLGLKTESLHFSPPRIHLTRTKCIEIYAYNLNRRNVIAPLWGRYQILLPRMEWVLTVQITQPIPKQFEKKKNASNYCTNLSQIFILLM